MTTMADFPLEGSNGAAVVINARKSQQEAEQVVAEIIAVGGKALVHLADVTDEAAVGRMVSEAVRVFGSVDILVSNAAIRGSHALVDLTLQEWRNLISVALDGAFLCTRAVLPHMLAKNYGRIVYIGGSSSRFARAGRTHVAAAKAGLVGLTRTLAIECSARGITVNCVAPGRIAGTDAAGEFALPLVGRLGTPDEIAHFVGTLCLPVSGFVSGQTFHVNGGLTG
jgi:3-oxoacyl-[acyl-carrier protein] reductase